MVSSFLRSRELSVELQESIISQFSDLGRVEVGDSSDVFNKLSTSLQVEVARCTSRRVVEKVPIMAGSNSNFLDALVVLLQVRLVAASIHRHGCMAGKIQVAGRDFLSVAPSPCLPGTCTDTGQLLVPGQRSLRQTVLHRQGESDRPAGYCVFRAVRMMLQDGVTFCPPISETDRAVSSL